MLQRICRLNLTHDERLTNVLRYHFIAICPESGAFMARTSGNPQTGNAPKYVLILPNKSVKERGGLLTDYEWDYPHGRKFIRAWTVDDAIEIANDKLAKMLECTK